MNIDNYNQENINLHKYIPNVIGGHTLGNEYINDKSNKNQSTQRIDVNPNHKYELNELLHPNDMNPPYYEPERTNSFMVHFIRNDVVIIPTFTIYSVNLPNISDSEFGLLKLISYLIIDSEIDIEYTILDLYNRNICDINVIVYELDPNGRIISTYKFTKCKLKSISRSILDWETSDTSTLTMMLDYKYIEYISSQNVESGSIKLKRKKKFRLN